MSESQIVRFRAPRDLVDALDQFADERGVDTSTATRILLSAKLGVPYVEMPRGLAAVSERLRDKISLAGVRARRRAAKARAS